MVNINNKEEKKIDKPIKIRENPFGRKNKKWYQPWKKTTEYGRRIELTKTQLEEATILNNNHKPIILNIKEENYKTIPEPETIEPVLFLMKENGYTEVLENVKTGEFIISTPKGEKSIWLTPDRMTTIKVGENYYRGWIAYENCMTPYPEDPIYSSELQRKIIQKVAINYQNLNEAAIITARTKMWLWIIGIIVISLVLLFSTDFGKQLISNFGKDAAQTTINAAKVASQNISSITQQINNQGVSLT